MGGKFKPKTKSRNTNEKKKIYRRSLSDPITLNELKIIENDAIRKSIESDILNDSTQNIDITVSVDIHEPVIETNNNNINKPDQSNNVPENKSIDEVDHINETNNKENLSPSATSVNIESLEKKNLRKKLEEIDDDEILSCLEDSDFDPAYEKVEFRKVS